MAAMTSFDAHAKATELTERSRLICRDEMRDLQPVKWPDLAAKRQAIDFVTTSHEKLTAHLGAVLSTLDHSRHTAEDVLLAQTELAAVNSVTDRRVQPHMRMTKVHGFAAQRPQHERELSDLQHLGDDHNRAIKLASWAQRIHKTLNFLHKLATTPGKLVGYAMDFTKFVSTKRAVGRGLARLINTKLTPKLDSIAAKLGKLGDDLKAASKFFSYAMVGLSVVSVVFATAADLGNWATAFGRSAADAAISVGAMVISESLSAAIASTLTALAGGSAASIEAPPVAAVLAAAGIILAATWVVVELVDFCIDWIFGAAHMPVSMYAPSAVLVAAGTTASISAPISKRIS